MLFWLTFNRSITFTYISHSIDFIRVWLKLFKNHAQRNCSISTLITPCFKHCCFSGQYSNYEVIFELLNAHYEAKIPHIMYFCIYFIDMTLIFWAKCYSVMPKWRFYELCWKCLMEIRKKTRSIVTFWGWGPPSEQNSV